MNQKPFPFYGAGDGNYYEWAEVVIRFTEAPSPPVMEQIILSAPSPIQPKTEDFHGKMLLASSDQYVNKYIQEAYGTSNGDEDDEEDPCFFVTEEALAAFDQDIERWLLSIHAICPIEYAYRPEDDEAGGTELSCWHEESLAATPALLEKWRNDPGVFAQAKEEQDLFAYGLQGIFEYGDLAPQDIPGEFLEQFFPEEKLAGLLQAEDWQGVMAFARAKLPHEEIQKSLIEHLQSWDIEQNRRTYLALLKELLPLLEWGRFDLAKLVGPMTYAALLEKDEEMVESITRKCSDTTTNYRSNYAGRLDDYAYTLYHKKPFAEIIGLYQIALSIAPPPPACTQLELYCNALWVLQQDNTGLPVNPPLNEEFLEKCLPYGPKNPAIYFNAACLYVEMKDFDKALEYAKLAKEYNFDQYDEMIRQFRALPMFADFRQDERVAALIS